MKNSALASHNSEVTLRYTHTLSCFYWLHTFSTPLSQHVRKKSSRSAFAVTWIHNGENWKTRAMAVSGQQWPPSEWRLTNHVSDIQELNSGWTNQQVWGKKPSLSNSFLSEVSELYMATLYKIELLTSTSSSDMEQDILANFYAVILIKNMNIWTQHDQMSWFFL